MGKQEPDQPRGANKYKHFPNRKLCLITFDEGFGGSHCCHCFSGANSFPLICNLLTSLPASLVQTAPLAVKSSGKRGLTWQMAQLKSELKEQNREGREVTR